MRKVINRNKKNLQKKYKGDNNLWIYNKDVNNIIKEFAKVQRDSKYNNSQDKYIDNSYNIIGLSFYKLVQFLKTYFNL